MRTYVVTGLLLVIALTVVWTLWPWLVAAVTWRGPL